MGSPQTKILKAPDQGSPAQRRVAAEALVVTTTVSLPAAVFSLVVLERKSAIIFGRAAFLRIPLSAGEAVVFVLTSLQRLVFCCFPSRYGSEIWLRSLPSTGNGREKQRLPFRRSRSSG